MDATDKQTAEMMARAWEQFMRRQRLRWWEKIGAWTPEAVAVRRLFKDIEAAMQRQLARRIGQQG